MAKQKNFTPLSALGGSLKEQTEALYEKTPTSTPPTPIEEKVTSPEPADEPRRPGRKKDNSIIPRRNGKLIFFEERHNRAVEDIHWQCKVDRQDVVRTALNEFLRLHVTNGEISAEGAALIQQYVRDTHV